MLQHDGTFCCSKDKNTGEPYSPKFQAWSLPSHGSPSHNMARLRSVYLLDLLSSDQHPAPLPPCFLLRPPLLYSVTTHCFPWSVSSKVCWSFWGAVSWYVLSVIHLSENLFSGLIWLLVTVKLNVHPPSLATTDSTFLSKNQLCICVWMGFCVLFWWVLLVCVLHTWYPVVLVIPGLQCFELCGACLPSLLSFHRLFHLLICLYHHTHLRMNLTVFTKQPSGILMRHCVSSTERFAEKGIVSFYELWTWGHVGYARGISGKLDNPETDCRV